MEDSSDESSRLYPTPDSVAGDPRSRHREHEAGSRSGEGLTRATTSRLAPLDCAAGHPSLAVASPAGGRCVLVVPTSASLGPINDRRDACMDAGAKDPPSHSLLPVQ